MIRKSIRNESSFFTIIKEKIIDANFWCYSNVYFGLPTAEYFEKIYLQFREEQHQCFPIVFYHRCIERDP